MSLTRKIGQNFFWRGFYLASMLVSNVLFARVLGADASGSFYFIINNVSLLVLVAGFCLETSFVYFGSSGKIAPGKLLVAGLSWTLIAATAGWIFGRLSFSSSAFGFPGWLWALFTGSFVLINYCSALFNTRQDFKTYNVLLTLVNFLFILFLLAIEISPGKLTRLFGIEQSDFISLVSIGYVITVVAQGMILLIAWCVKAGKLSLEWPIRNEWVLMIQYALLSLLANIVFFLVYRIDYWFVNYFQQDSTQLGNYIQVSKLGQLFIMLPSMMATVIFPATALDGQPGIRQELMRLCRVFFSAYALILLLISIGGYWLFPLIFGNSFDKMFGAFAALSPGIIALSLQSLMAAWFAGKNNVRFNVYGALLSLAVIVFFDLLLIPRFGIVGASIASSIGYTAYCAYCMYKFRSEGDPTEKFSLIVDKSDVLWLRNIIGALTGKN